MKLISSGEELLQKLLPVSILFMPAETNSMAVIRLGQNEVLGSG
jgi:hypothetical protein